MCVRTYVRTYPELQYVIAIYVCVFSMCVRPYEL